MIKSYDDLSRGRDAWLKNDVGEVGRSSTFSMASRTRWLFSLLAVVLLFWGNQLNAQTATIGSGTTTTTSTGNDPIDGYYNSFRYQVVYTAAELTAAGMPANSSITALGFSIAGDYGGGALLGYTIRMGNTTATTSSAHDTSTTSVVKTAFSYDPTVTAAGAFDMITLTTPFTWNGTSNILIDICSSGSNPFTSPYGQVRTIASSTTDGSRFYRVDSANACGVNTDTANSTKPQIRFTYTAAVACSGTPAPGNTVTSSASGCSGTTANLSLQNATNGTGVTYQWQSSPTSGGTYTDISGATGPTYTLTVNATAWYRATVTCSGNTGISTPVQVSLKPVTQCYCVPVTTYGCGDGDVIARVTLNTLDNNSGTGCPSDPVPGNQGAGQNGPGYSDYTSNPALTTTLQAGGSYGCTVYAGQYSEGYAAWIDYNDDGVFNNATERIGFSSGQVTGSGTAGVLGSSATFPIVLACNPPLGVHRLRVRAMFSTNGSAVTPCTDNSYGEIEDYLVTVSAAVACPAPTALTATATSTTGGTLSWTVGCVETAWQVAVQAAGSGTPTGAGTPVSGSPTYTVSGLTPGAYEYYVRADCSGNGYSTWSGPYMFTPPLCPTLTSPANGATNVAIPGGGVPLTWSAVSGATSYDVYFGQTAGATVLLGNIATTSVNITGVANGSTNFWKIIAKNVNGDSTGCAEFSFTTVSCGTQTVPYTQGFETIGFANALADCVTASPTPSSGGKTQTYIANGTNAALVPRTGTKFGAVYWSPTGKGTFFTPAIQLTAGTSYRASVYYKTDGVAWPTVGLYYGTSNTEAAMTNVIATVTNAAATTYTLVQGDFIAPSTGVYYIGFQADNTGNSAPNYCAFDDFSLVVGPTVVSSFNPSSACADSGTTVTITGSQFLGATAVSFNGVPATSFSVVDNTTITAVLPNGATTGYVTVVSPQGTGTSTVNFTVNPNPTVANITSPNGETNICIPETLALNNITPTGIWSSSNTDVATVSTSGLVTPVAAGNVVISYTVTDGGTGCSTAKTYALSVSEPVQITSSTPSQSVTTGNNTSFSVTATGTGSPSLSYAWEVCTDGSGVNFSPVVDDAVYSGSNTATLSLTGVPAAYNGYFYQCLVSGVCGEVYSDLAVLVVGETGIETQPTNVTICEGGPGTASFSVVASADVTDYLWYEDQGGDNWMPITNGGMYAGATTATLSLSGLTLANSGWRYKAVVTGIGSAESNPATLTVAQGATITSNPVNQSVCYTGGGASFSAAASGGVTGYAWQYSGDNGASWNNVVNGTPSGVTYAGANTITLNVTTSASTPAAGPHLYRAVAIVTSPCTNVPSASAQLIINNPTVSGQPAASSVLAGGSTTFTVSTAAPSPSYQWQYATAAAGPWANVVDATPAGVTYGGATSATLTVNASASAAASNARYYRAVVSSPVGCSVNSNAAQLTIVAYCVPTYTNGTGSGDYISNVTVVGTTLNNNTVGAASPYHTVFPQTGSTTATVYKGSTYTISVKGGTYSTCYVSAWADYNNDGTFAASEFIGVSPNCGASTTVNLTTNWLIPAGANTGNIRVRFRSSDTSPGPTSAQACGATNSGYGEGEDYILTFLAPPACSGTPTAGTVTSSVANVCLSGSATLTATGYSANATGLSYQWYNSAGAIASATGFTYTTPVLSAPESYYFQVTCANGGASANSNTVTIGVDNPSITSSSGATRCGTGSVTLNATGSTGTSVAWYAANAGGAPLGLGTSYSPSVSATTTFYAEAYTGVGSGSAGLATNAVSTNGVNVGSHGIAITTTTANVKVNGATIPFTGTGTITIALKNTANTTTIATSTSTTVTGNGLTPVMVPFSLTIPTAGSYILVVSAVSGTVNNLGYATGTYPYTSLAGAFQVTSGYWYGNVTDNLYLFNVSVSAGCSSARTAVTATVNTPPTLTISSNAATVCAGQSSPLVTVTSNVANYDSYVWSPSTGVTGTPAAGYTFTNPATTTYTLTATNSTSGCANTVPFVLTVNPVPAAVTLTPSAVTLCSVNPPVLISRTGVGSPATGGCLTATSGQYPATAFTASTCDGTTVQSITAAAWAGEYSLVNTSANTRYVFTSSVATDYVTISNATGTTVLAAGLTPVTYISSAAGQVRFYTHTNSACGEEQVSRTRAFTCVDMGVVFSPTAGLYTDAAGTIAYTGAATTSVYAKPAATQTYTATATNSFGCTSSAQVTVTVNTATTWYVDADGDGYGNSALPTIQACGPQTGYAAVGGDCNDSVAAINPGHAEVLYNGVDDNCDGQLDETGQLTTSLLAAYCNVTLASLNSTIGITTVAGHTITGYRIKAVNGANTQIIERTVPNFTMGLFPTHDYATTYTISIELQRSGVWLGYYGPTCQVSTPAILDEGGAAAVNPSQCGITLPKINTLIATTSIPNVTGYRFRVTNLTDTAGPNQVQVLDRTQNWFSLPMLARYNYGTLYRIEVAVKTTGTYGGYGQACEVTSPAAPSLTNCGGFTATSGTQTISATSVSGVTQYRFQLTRLSDNATASIDRAYNWFTFNMVPSTIFTAGATYGVRVAVMTTGTWSPFGDACEVTAPGAQLKGATGNDVLADAEFRAVATPNPFASDFNVTVTSASREAVNLKVYDMLGKLLEDRNVRFEGLDVERVGANYPAGVYNVIVTQGENVRTLRVIKR